MYLQHYILRIVQQTNLCWFLIYSEHFWIMSRHHNMSHHIKTRSNHGMSYPFMSFHNPRTLQPPTSLSQPMMNWWYMNLMCSCPPCHYTWWPPWHFAPTHFIRAYKGYYIKFLKWQEKVSCARCDSWASLACKHELTATLCAELCKNMFNKWWTNIDLLSVIQVLLAGGPWC